MLPFLNKYLNKHHHHHNQEDMVCPQGCCFPTDPTTSHSKTPTTTTRTSRSNFAKATASTLFPTPTKFTNHESLPSLPSALSSFTATYPQYTDTHQADHIRDRHYPHLSTHVCLDYSGFTLFSHTHTHTHPPFFAISHNSVSLNSQIQYGTQKTGLESAIRTRIMNFLRISDEDYGMVCTANRTTAFRLLAETYPFHSNRRLLTVYDHDTEAVAAMLDAARKRGAKVMSAAFSWPSLRIHSAKLKKILIGRKKKNRGLFVFPLQSRMSGAKYPYLWMKIAQENGWDVVLDACALGPKDMDTLGLSLIHPDFIICSFFKVFGENPSGFASLFMKKCTGSSSTSVLETSALARSIGIVSIVPATATTEDFSSSSFSGPICNGSQFEHGETSEIQELEGRDDGGAAEIECVGLDHADSLGLMLIGSRLRCIANWLVMGLLKLRHPHPEDGHSLVKIYGPRIKFDRGPALAFNVFDWKGEKVEPTLVQKLADRSNISLSCGFLHNIWFSEKHEEQRDAVLERRMCEMTNVSGSRRKEQIDLGVSVVNASLGFLTNFEDAYKLWSFVAKFLDADFVEKERWRYMALNQKMIEV